MRRAILILFSLVLLGAGGLGLASWLGRAPLAGETSHDFGMVTFVVEAGRSKPVELFHTFHLLNRTGRTIMIQGMSPNCGCITISPDARLPMPIYLNPGQGFDLPVKLTLTAPGSESGGSRSVHIVLDLADEGTQILRMHVAGRFETDSAGAADSAR